MDLHRFFTAIARAAVNDGGQAGVALHPTVWSSGGPAKVRKVRVSAWEFAWVPGPVGLWRHGSIGWPSIEVGDGDVGFWPYSVGLLVKFCSFLSSLHWPSTVDDLGVGGVSYVELLLLYERWAGERLVLEMSVPKSRRLHRPISVSAVPDGPSIDIWRSCRFLGAMIRALCGLPGGLGRFLPCRVGSNHCRLRSIGWERCGHGLTSRPLEASGVGFLEDLLVLFGYPAGSGHLLVDGSLWMRYCSANFSCKKPTWGCLHPVVLQFWFALRLFVRWLVILRVLGMLLGIETLVTMIERGYDLPKRLMLKSGPGFISGNSQFPSVGRVAHWIFAFLVAEVGFFVLGLGSVMLMNQRELAENQVAQSHASR